MKYKKKGFLLVVLVLLVFNVFLAFGELNLNEDKYLGLSFADDEGEADAGPVNLYFNSNWCTSAELVDEAENQGTGCAHKTGEAIKSQECAASDYAFTIPPPIGCWFLYVDEDDDSADDGAIGKIGCGGILGTSPTRLYVNDPKTICGDTNALETMKNQGITLYSATPYLCADDNYWHKCNANKDDAVGGLGTKTWANYHIYECSIDSKGIPVWTQLPGKDIDHDGYTDQAGDCYDYDNLTYIKSSFCSDLKTPEDCGSVGSYRCAICINPGAPEVCGDKINNDCGGSEDPEEMEDWNDLGGETDDDCNKNQYSCEQKENLDFKKS